MVLENNNISGFLKISILDGYQEGDILLAPTSVKNCHWDQTSHTLEIPINSSLKEIRLILHKVSLQGQGDTERYIKASLVDEEGEKMTLYENAIAPDNANIPEHMYESEKIDFGLEFVGNLITTSDSYDKIEGEENSNHPENKENSSDK